MSFGVYIMYWLTFSSRRIRIKLEGLSGDFSLHLSAWRNKELGLESNTCKSVVIRPSDTAAKQYRGRERHTCSYDCGRRQPARRTRQILVIRICLPVALPFIACRSIVRRLFDKAAYNMMSSALLRIFLPHNIMMQNF